jgi:hypothetical protein
MQQHPPKQKRAQAVRQDIDDVIAQRMAIPTMPLQPQGSHRHRQRIDGPGGEPQIVQSASVAQHLIIGHHDAVVPDKTPMQGRQISQKNQEEQPRAP